MPRIDFDLPRLFVDAPLQDAAQVALSREQANYLGNVLRLGDGDAVLVFNGRDGEWRTRVRGAKRSISLEIAAQTRAQTAAADVHYLFAPLKHARLDYMVQKAVEMGAARLQPVLTRRTQVSRINLERMRANTIEAAEQCGILTLAEVADEIRLDKLLMGWSQDPLLKDRLLICCDEDAPVANPLDALRALQTSPPRPVSVLIGPEGGFDDTERARIRALPHVCILSLGPRILRADTAAVAALAVVQATLGDWVAPPLREPPVILPNPLGHG